MRERFRQRLLSTPVYILALFTCTLCQPDVSDNSQTDGSDVVHCYTDDKYDYFMHTVRKTWDDAENKCRADSGKISSGQVLIEKCTTNSYDGVADVTVKVWLSKTEGSGWWKSDKCTILVYQNGNFEIGGSKDCEKKRQFVCYGDKAIEEPSTSTTTTLAAKAATTRTSTSTMTKSATIPIKSTLTILDTTTQKYTRSDTTAFISTTVTQATVTTSQTLSTSTEKKKSQSARASTGTDASPTGAPVADHQTSNEKLLNDGVISAIVVGIVFCVVAVLAVLFVIRRRNQNYKKRNKKKQKHGASNMAYEHNTPDVIPLESKQQTRTDDSHFEVEPHTRVEDSSQEIRTYYNIQALLRDSTDNNEKHIKNKEHIKNDGNAKTGTSTEEYTEVSSHQDDTRNNYAYATSGDVTVTAKDAITDSDTYDHIKNKHMSPVCFDDTVYSHTVNDVNDEYAHTNFKPEKKRTPLDMDNVYTSTEPDIDVEYSHTNVMSQIGQINSEEDDTYNHTKGQPPAYQSENAGQVYSHLQFSS